jgi:hypothetical protein
MIPEIQSLFALNGAGSSTFFRRASYVLWPQ